MMRRTPHLAHTPSSWDEDLGSSASSVDDQGRGWDTIHLIDHDNSRSTSNNNIRAVSNSSKDRDEEVLPCFWAVEREDTRSSDGGNAESPSQPERHLSGVMRRRRERSKWRGLLASFLKKRVLRSALRWGRYGAMATPSSRLAVLLGIGAGAFLLSVLLLSSALVGLPSKELGPRRMPPPNWLARVVIPSISSSAPSNRRRVQPPRIELAQKRNGGGFSMADYGGLYIDVFEEPGASRAIYHDFSLDEGKLDRQPNEPHEETVDAYYAYDDDARRNPYRYQPDHAGKLCRRTKFHRRLPINCNSVYELDLAAAMMAGRSQYVGAGSYRNVYLFQADNNETYVYKTSGIQANYRYDDYEFIRMDCLVLELLSSHPSIVNSYGYCGLDQIGEAMLYGDFEQVAVPLGGRVPIKLKDKEQLDPQNKLTPSQKLQFALEMAEPLALLHGFRGGVLVHDDLQLPQYLLTADGHIKLNDFNRAEFMLWNAQDQEYCKYKNNPGHGDWRAPEEYFDDPLDEKIDIFSLGNNLYAVLTGLYPFYSILDSKKVKENVKRGLRPYIDPRWSTNSYAEGKIVELMKRCWKFKPEDRIDIFEAVQFLREAVKENAKRTNSTL